MKKLRFKLILAFLSAVIIPLVITEYFTLSRAETYAKESFQTRFTSEVKQIDYGLTMMFKLIGNNVSLLGTNSSIIDNQPHVSRYLDLPATQMTPTNNPNEAQIYNYFEHIASNFEQLNYIYFGTEQGGYVQWPNGGKTDYYDPRIRPWYLAGIGGQGTPVRAPAYYWAADNSTLISTVKQVTDKNGKSLGVVGMDITLSALTKMLENIGFGYQGSLLVIEDTGRVLADTRNPENVFKMVEASENNALTNLVGQDKAFSDTPLLIGSNEYYAINFTSPYLN